MTPCISTLAAAALAGRRIGREDAQRLAAESTKLDELLYWAGHVREQVFGDRVALCGIVNARSGRCGEDCRFCAQSSHYDTEVPGHPLLDAGEIFAAAEGAAADGAGCFGIVTSGSTVGGDELATIAAAVERIRRELDIGVSASLGQLDRDALERLAGAGLTSYHHNLETSERYFPQICTTHTWRERVGTIESARAAGLPVCSGALLGLGETWADRIDIAGTLADLGVASVPLNFLHPVGGTPLGERPKMSPREALRSIALFRFILPGANLRICGGRGAVLRDLQSWVFQAGASGMMIGNYLTTSGRGVEDDMRMLADLGLEPAG
jgi:biotin synthase